jgi:ABC-type Fe3+/spermidine/putrescine transport system ATPase subunit
MLLDVSHVSKSYPGLPVLHDVSFEVEEGEIVCMLGPSGCGKTTLLRLIAGLEAPDTGRIAFAGGDLSTVPAHRRNFGLMFQDYALFPHKDVAANVAFGLRMQGWTPEKTAARVDEMLQLVELGGYERRRVNELSGGEQQRVALARSLAPKPRLLMFDEPLGSLDRALREQLMNSLRGILKQVGVTALYVTHDQEEAFAIADRVFIMQPGAGEGGRIVQGGSPQEVYCRPQSAYVAGFLGFRNLLGGTVIAIGDSPDAGAGNLVRVEFPRLTGRDSSLSWLRDETAGADPLRMTPKSRSDLAPGDSVSSTRPCGAAHAWIAVETPVGKLTATGDIPEPIAAGAQVTVLVRPEAATILPAGAQGDTANAVAGRLLSASFRGSFYLIRTAHHGDVVLTSEVPAADLDMPAAGSPLMLRLNPAAISVLR